MLVDDIRDMSHKRIWKVFSIASFGIGAAAGFKISKIHTAWPEEINDTARPGKLRAWEDLLPMPAVSASSLIPSGGLSDVFSTPRVNTELNKFGNPSADNALNIYEDFVVSYDRKSRTAQWVFEHINREKVQKNENIKREECQFYTDRAIHPLFRSTNEDYKGSGYDRGHLSPAANHRWSQKAMNQSFVLSNISPQVGKGFNRDGWEHLERYIRHLTKEYTNIYICTGPLYLPRREDDGKLYVKYEVIGKNNVAVPTHFFKVALLEKNQGEFELLSFVMPNQVLPDKVELKKYLVPLESIERAAGFLLFNRLPKNNIQKINGKKV